MGLVRHKTLIPHGIQQPTGAFCKVQDLFLIGYLAATNGDPIKQRFNLDEGQRIAFQLPRVPYKFRHYPVQVETHPFAAMDGNVLGDHVPLPLKTEGGEQFVIFHKTYSD